MVRKQQQYTLNVEQTAAEQLLRHPHCSPEGAHCGCRSHYVACELHGVTKNPCSLWKIFLICLLACLLATAITALALYFRPFGNPTNTTIIINTDGRPSQEPCTSASTPSLTSTPSPGSETTAPSTSITTPAATTTTPTTTTTVTTIATTEHEAIIEYDYLV
ncbi:dynactin-associated protein-like [Psammomys obesus]|uniref:dynactin-associated protein-like n=1 Tax=Psammomys obesus TaxID=48139 RepID=UPI002452C209|nr:dynactin-associated protein-like [Psammomys obesus]